MSLSRLLGRLYPAALVSLYLCSLLFLLPGILRHIDRPGARLSRSSQFQSSAHFAIADFDGDAQPDLATIRVTRSSTPAAEYFLELELSSGLRPSIGLVGPAGGLLITPEDVNGDKIADLVVTSLLDKQFVAIFLNDGKGNFRQVERSEYPEAGKQPDARLLWESDPTEFQLTLGQHRGMEGGEVQFTRLRRPAQVSMQLPSSSPISIPSFLALSLSGRSPPLV